MPFFPLFLFHFWYLDQSDPPQKCCVWEDSSQCKCVVMRGVHQVNFSAHYGKCFTQLFDTLVYWQCISFCLFYFLFGFFLFGGECNSCCNTHTLKHLGLVDMLAYVIIFAEKHLNLGKKSSLFFMLCLKTLLSTAWICSHVLRQHQNWNKISYRFACMLLILHNIYKTIKRILKTAGRMVF